MKRYRSFILLVSLCAIFILLTTTLFLAKHEASGFLVENGPPEVLQNYLLALHNQAYELAYSYLADAEYKPEYNTFRQFFSINLVNEAETGLEMGKAQVTDGNAQVTLRLIDLSGSFPGFFRREMHTASLQLQAGHWKIIQAPEPFWSWEWYSPPVNPPEIPPVTEPRAH